MKSNLMFKDELPTTPAHYINITASEHVRLLHDDLRHSEVKYVALDTETTGLGRLDTAFGFSLAIGSNDQPLRCYWFRFDTLEEGDAVFDYMKDELKWLFSQQDIGIIMHNSIFDLRMLKQTFPDIPFLCRKLNDTMLMAKVLKFKYKSAALKELGHIILGAHEHWEKYIQQWFTNSDYKGNNKPYDSVPDLLMFPYACADTELTYKLFFELRKSFREFPVELEQIYLLERQVAPITSSMEFYGMPIDKQYLLTLKEQLTKLLADWMQEFRELWGKDFNPDSFKQKGEVLYGTDEKKNQLALPITFKTDGGAGKTDAETLEYYADEKITGNLRASELIGKLSMYGRISHLLQNFVDGILERLVEYEGKLDVHEHNPTIHTMYDQVIATGRFSSRDINLQNIPNDAFSRTRGLLEPDKVISIRRAFVCPKDYVYCKFDYAAFELRILGNASQDKKFIAMVLDGVDLHSWLATRLYKHDMFVDKSKGKFTDEQMIQWTTKSENEISQRWDLPWEYWAIKSKANPDLMYRRNMVKICSFEIYYGAGANKIATTHHITTDEAKRLKGICFDTFTTVADWRNAILAYAQRFKRVQTLFGRLIDIEENRIWTQAVNAIIQGTAADLLKFALIEMNEVLKRKTHPGTRLIAVIHDEIQILLHKNDVHLIDRIVEAMEMPKLDTTKYPLLMLCEPAYTLTNWSEMKDIPEIDNSYEKGLRSCL